MVENFDAVLAVPLRFANTGFRDVHSAASEAGFNILQIIPEPFADLLAYKIGLNREARSNVLVYRSGGLTSDITLYRVKNRRHKQLDYVHLQYGGNLLTKTFDDSITGKGRRLLSAKQYKETILSFFGTSENVKHFLSTSTDILDIYFKVDNIRFASLEATRTSFENAIESILPLFRQPIENLLATHQLNVDKVSEIRFSFRTFSK